MKYVNSKKEPSLLGFIEYEDELVNVEKMVDNMNQDLVDSGFDTYQYKTIRRGDKLYIERDI